MVHVFVLLLVGILNGTLANDTPAEPFLSEQDCQDGAAALAAFARSHGVIDDFTLMCVPATIVKRPQAQNETEADK